MAELEEVKEENKFDLELKLVTKLKLDYYIYYLKITLPLEIRTLNKVILKKKPEYLEV